MMFHETTPMRRLTSIQAKFVDEYLRCGNGTRAAIAAGYSPKTARSIASENLAKPAIQEALRLGRAQQTEQMQTKGQAYLLQLKRMYEVSICSMYDEKNRLRHPKLWDPDVLAIVKDVKIRSRKNGALSVNVKFVDRMKILEAIGHAVGAFAPASKRRKKR